jgi:hypothetical protein
MIVAALVPSESQIFGWIEQVFRQGVRLPGYAADRWTEQWAQGQFSAFGLERVRAEPVPMWSWEPKRASLVVSTPDGSLRADESLSERLHRLDAELRLAAVEVLFE